MMQLLTAINPEVNQNAIDAAVRQIRQAMIERARRCGS
jgi:hypothetical protein